MIRWGASQYLLLLFAVPAIVAILAVGGWLKRRALARLADAPLIPRLTDSRSPRLAFIRTCLLLTGLTLAILSAARPQWGEKLQVYKGRGIDIVVALDASKSMLAADVSPNRLARAKTQIGALIDNLATHRVGIVAFAGDAQVLCPLTPDVDAAKLFLDIIDPDNMPRPGTNIQKAVEAAASIFDSGEGSKALILVTDGDNLEGDPSVTTRIALEQRIRIFAVGVGTPEGTTIPEAGAGTAYKKDENDKIVVTRLAERMLLVMAKATDGRYFRSEQINLDDVVASLEQMQKKSIGGGEYVEFEERYQLFLLPAFVLLFAGLLMSDRRGAWFRLPRWQWRGIGSRRAAPLTAILIAGSLGLLSVPPAGADVGSRMRAGLALEKQGKFDEAIKAYEDALVLQPDNVRIHYDIGRAQYRLKKYPEAIESLQLALLSRKKPLQAKTLYNIGNSHFRQNKLDEAIASYMQSLVLDPRNMDAKQNLEYCWKLKNEQKQQPDSTQQQQQQQDQQQQQQQPQAGNQDQQQSPQQAQARPGAIGKDQADRMLQALAGKEKENLKNRPKQPSAKSSSGKDW